MPFFGTVCSDAIGHMGAMMKRLLAVTSLAVASHLALLLSGCVSPSGPSEYDDTIHTGFEGEWFAQVHDARMTLEIGDFVLGISSEGRVYWQDFDWRLSCGIAVAYGPNELSCHVWPDISGCRTLDGVPSPYIDIQSADSTGITAIVGGHLRPLSCDTLLVEWEPASDVVFRRP